ncbi:MAG: TolC family protein [candidate division KSB1 bacterium]|nr:TolC family protein [candidate division KSB1 bacterium]
MKRGVLLIVSLAVVLAGNLYAQGERPLSLEDCINIALKNNSQLRNAERNVNRAGAAALGSWSGVLPRINSSFASGRFIQGDRLRKTDVPVGIDTTTGKVIYAQREIIQEGVSRYSHYARVSLSQNIFDWGQSWNLIKRANAGHSSAEHSLVSTRQAVIFNVKQKYYDLLKAIKLEQVYNESVTRAEEQLKRTQSMYEIGSVALADVYKARVNLGTAKSNLITQRNLVAMARANLNTALGREPDMPLEVVELEPEELPLPYTFEQAREIALEHNPELKSLENEVRMAEYEVKNAKVDYLHLPTIGASISYSRDNEIFNRVYTNQLNRDFSVSLGISIDLNIFNGFSDKAQYEQSSINYQIAKENLLDRKRTLIAEVKQAFLSLQAYKEIAELNEENLKSAEEDLRLAQERYRVGAGTLLEVIDAQVALTSARSQLVSAKYNAKVAQAQLEAAMGILER